MSLQNKFILKPPKEWEENDSIKTENKIDITKEPLIIDGKEVGCILRHVLTPEECSHFISVASEDGHLVDLSHNAKYRNMKRGIGDSALVAKVIYDRIRPHLSEVIEVNAMTSSIHQDYGGASHGFWKPYGINDHLRFGYYTPGGHFAPHYDGEYKINSRNKSLQTCQLYLNGNFKGGGINFIGANQELYQDPNGRFCAEEKNIIQRIKPEPGLAVIFNHKLMHEGEALEDSVDNPKKFFMRSEIMFRNEQPTGKPLTENDEKALKLIQEADHLEFSGKALEAAKYWMRAFKLSPALEAHYNSGGQINSFKEDIVPPPFTKTTNQEAGILLSHDSSSQSEARNPTKSLESSCRFCKTCNISAADTQTLVNTPSLIAELHEKITNVDVEGVRMLLQGNKVCPNCIRDEKNPEPFYQPDRPLKLVMFCISNCLLTEEKIKNFKEIAELLLANGADPISAMQIAESRYGQFQPKKQISSNKIIMEVEDPFQEVWSVVAEAAEKIKPGQIKFLNDNHEPLLKQ